jgi:Protein of unknown function (DUF2795)
VVTTSLYRSVAGIHRGDIARLNLALAGVSYPAQKWQLIAYAERDPIGHGRTDLRTSRQLWALPSGQYADTSQVLVGAARTARGHPHRIGAGPSIG